MIIAGIDIGNSTTEVCIGKIDATKQLSFLSEAMSKTTGTKGTVRNIDGIIEALEIATAKINIKLSDIDEIRMNQAAPVISDTAMETITETVITDSTMIGHNPDTPAGAGLAVGTTYLFSDIMQLSTRQLMLLKDEKIILIVPKTHDFEMVAQKINDFENAATKISGIILEKDEAVLVYNRLARKVPIVDEVQHIDRVPVQTQAAIEVAPNQGVIRELTNPYGLAKIFKLDGDDVKIIVPIAKSLIGLRSGIVFKTNKGSVETKKVKSGSLIFEYKDGSEAAIKIDSGAEAIRDFAEEHSDSIAIDGEKATRIGEMFTKIKRELASVSTVNMDDVRISDILAVDSYVPLKVRGALSGEISMEKAVGIAAMVKANQFPMEQIARKLREKINVNTKVVGIEAVMASLGALTTKGVTLPMVLLDLGGGSTDGAYVSKNGTIRSMHFAGAGNFVTMMINKELALTNPLTAERIKVNPLAKVESLFHIRYENGAVEFFKEPLDSRLFGKIVAVTPDGLKAIETSYSMERLIETRKRVKKDVFANNAVRALKKIAPNHQITDLESVVLVGGSALDFEIPEMLVEYLSKYNIVVGRADIRGSLGPRNAVATGLVISYLDEQQNSEIKT